MGLGALNGIVEGALGKHGEAFLPFIGTIFLYVMLMNLMGLIPGIIAPTSNFSTTAALALTDFPGGAVLRPQAPRDSLSPPLLRGTAAISRSPGSTQWLLWVWRVLANGLLGLLIFVIHLIGELVRPVSLAIRLFGNISGEETVVAALVGLMAATRYLLLGPRATSELGCSAY